MLTTKGVAEEGAKEAANFEMLKTKEVAEEGAKEAAKAT